mgnify:CR=1 FL=1
MFTGLIEEVGTIQNVRRGARSCVLTIGCKKSAGRQSDRRQHCSQRCVPDSDEHGRQLLYRRCYGRDNEPKFSEAVKYWGKRKSGAGDAGKRQIWRSYRIGTYRWHRNGAEH